jgi:hypothetical protein
LQIAQIVGQQSLMTDKNLISSWCWLETMCCIVVFRPKGCIVRFRGDVDLLQLIAHKCNRTSPASVGLSFCQSAPYPATKDPALRSHLVTRANHNARRANEQASDKPCGDRTPQQTWLHATTACHDQASIPQARPW